MTYFRIDQHETDEKHLNVLHELTKTNKINKLNKQFGIHHFSAECGQVLDIIITAAESDRFKIDPKPQNKWVENKI